MRYLSRGPTPPEGRFIQFAGEAVSLGEQFDEVLVAAQAGAPWAIGLIYKDLQPRVLRYLVAREPKEGEDLAAQVWMDVASSLKAFRGGEVELRAWLFTIARRRLIDHRRRTKRRPAVLAPTEDLADRPANDDPEETAVISDSSAEAFRRISSLPKDQADVVLLRVVGGFSVEEVARILRKKPGTVRVLQHRALKALAKEFSQDR